MAFIIYVCLIPYLIAPKIGGAVSDRPSWQTIPKDVVVIEGSDALLQCSLSLAGSPVPPSWLKKNDNHEFVYISNGKMLYDPCCSIQGNVDEGEYNLRIYNVSVRDDEREYQCVHIQADPQRQNAQVTVIDRPSWQTIPKHMEVIEGNDAVLHCSLSLAAVPPMWLKKNDNHEFVYISNGTMLYDPCCSIEGNVDEGEYNLRIYNVSVRDDEREYQCHQKQADVQRQNAQITVIVPVSNVTIKQLPEVTGAFICEAKRGKPPANLKLFVNDIPVISDEEWLVRRVGDPYEYHTEDSLAMFFPNLTRVDGATVLFCQAIQMLGDIHMNSTKLYVNVSQIQDDEDFSYTCNSSSTFGLGFLAGISTIIVCVSAIGMFCYCERPKSDNENPSSSFRGCSGNEQPPPPVHKESQRHVETPV